MSDTLAVVTSFATAVGALAAVAGILYAAIQLRASRKLAKGQFLLRLDERFDKHDDVNRKLRPSGVWAKPDAGPSSDSEWATVDGYMGLFERINVLVRDGIMDMETVNKLYGYRVRNIAANFRIRQAKLEIERHMWHDFIELERRLAAVSKETVDGAE